MYEKQKYVLYYFKVMLIRIVKELKLQELSPLEALGKIVGWIGEISLFMVEIKE